MQARTDVITAPFESLDTKSRLWSMHSVDSTWVLTPQDGDVLALEPRLPLGTWGVIVMKPTRSANVPNWVTASTLAADTPWPCRSTMTGRAIHPV